jgi:CDP-ribitol ribitolphosphotransferase
MYYLQTARLFVVDNAYLPIHVAPHRSGTTVVQVWHAVGALKRFGADTLTPLTEPERTFLHRHYDYVVTTSEIARAPYAAALRTPIERVLALGAPRTDFFFDESVMAAARARLLDAYPHLAGRRIVLYAPTFRGRGPAKRAGGRLDAARLRGSLPEDHALVLKTHPNLDPATTPKAGFDVVANPASEINDWLALADILITDYSSSIFEYALLRRPLILLVPDLEAYERDPGLYLDFRTEMIGTQVVDTDGVIDAIAAGHFDTSGYDAFIARHVAADGSASRRFVDRFLEGGRKEAR